MTSSFLSGWAEAAMTSLGFFWTALWAFCLGYLISAMIQVLVTEARMQRTMGRDGPRSVALAVGFGFLSSSCSFAALSTSRALFQKGAGLVPALAFLLASTNLVIELGILIYVFLGWPFVAGEYLGGLLLIAIMWLLVRSTLPARLEEEAREHSRIEAEGEEDEGDLERSDWRERIRSRDGWERIAKRYFMEWKMVWRDVTFGFTVAGVIAAFVPDRLFRTLFVGADAGQDPAIGELVLQAAIGPLAAFFTFIGSMGNIPLASLLFASGVSFAGVMAFLFSDLVVFPVLRISARYFGWRMAVYILGVFLVCLITTSTLLHVGFDAVGWLPASARATHGSIRPESRFAIDHTLALDLLFLGVTGVLGWLSRGGSAAPGGDAGDPGRDVDESEGCGMSAEDDMDDSGAAFGDRLLRGLALLSFAWIVGGAGVALFAR